MMYMHTKEKPQNALNIIVRRQVTAARTSRINLKERPQIKTFTHPQPPGWQKCLAAWTNGPSNYVRILQQLVEHDEYAAPLPPQQNARQSSSSHARKQPRERWVLKICQAHPRTFAVRNSCRLRLKQKNLCEWQKEPKTLMLDKRYKRGTSSNVRCSYYVLQLLQLLLCMTQS